MDLKMHCVYSFRDKSWSMENHIKEKREYLCSNLQSIYSFLDVTKPSLICRLSIASTISGSMDQ